MPKAEDAEQERLVAFLNKERQALQRRARQLVRSSEVAEDLVQDLAIKMLRQENLSAIQSLRQYVYTAIHRLALDHLEQEAIRSRCLVTESAENQLDEFCVDEVDPGQIYECQCLIKALRASATQFPPQFWKAFRLNAEGYTQREIAERLGCSAAKVNAMLKRMREVARHVSACHRGQDRKL
ncbi:MAG: RNA polymerase sigma factor [Lautropia sp.]|nr:RNA polymerase sigma factor [Lautropia sp.]